MPSTIYTEDQVRDIARQKLHLEETESAKAGVGQLTSFNQLGFRGVKDRPDGWYLPNETYFPALVLEVKGSNMKLGVKEREELLKNIRIVETRYKHVVGLLYNGFELEVYKNEERVDGESELMDKEHYLGLFATNRINKLLIYSLTHSINDTLHFDFLIKNLYHRMIFTACALVAKRYGATLVKSMSFKLFTTSIRETLESSLSESVCYNGSIGEAFYQDAPYWATDDVNVLTPKFKLTPYIAIFIATIIKNESIKYAFNHKWTKELMERSEIVLPAKSDGTPDFDFMEQYVKSLPYSRFFSSDNQD